MKLNELLKNDAAVSPVIGVILMVAITVILAAVIGTFVLGIGDQVGKETPQTRFGFEETGSNQQIEITHDGGDKVKVANIDTAVTDGNDPGCDTQAAWGSGTELTAGDTCTTNSIGSGTSGTLRITWTSDDEPNSGTLATYDYEY